MTKNGKHCGKKTCNFFFCHYVFKKPSAAEASESVYMRERVNVLFMFTNGDTLSRFSSNFGFKQLKWGHWCSVSDFCSVL